MRRVKHLVLAAAMVTMWACGTESGENSPSGKDATGIADQAGPDAGPDAAGSEARDEELRGLELPVDPDALHPDIPEDRLALPDSQNDGSLPELLTGDTIDPDGDDEILDLTTPDSHPDLLLSICPDAICDGDETCHTCPQDCGACPPVCPDGECNGDESCDICPQDCGDCPPACPDGTCNGDETCEACPQDCGECPPVCPAYPDWDGLFCGDPLPKQVPGIRLFFSLTWSNMDASVCGSSTWKLGNRILLNGSTPDGIPRGRLEGAELYYDVDDLTEDEIYYDDTGAERLIPFAIELLDTNKELLWRGRHRLPLQVREYVLRALEEKAGMAPAGWMFPLVAGALGADFEAFTLVIPDLPGASYLRFKRELSAEEKAATPACAPGPLVLPVYYKSSGGPTTEVPISAIQTVPVSSFHNLTSEVLVQRLFGDANPANAVNITILSDGYLAADKGEFQEHAAQVTDFLMNLDPYKSFSKFVNVWSIWTPSAEQGASYDCACTFFDAPGDNCAIPHDGCRDALRDVMYGSIFTVRALFAANPLSTDTPTSDMDRNIFPIFLSRIGLAQSVSASDGTPVSGDVAIMLTREEKRGAFGFFSASVTTAYGDDPDPLNLAQVATHELGHAFGLLGDEYSVASDVCQNYELTPLFPNFSHIPQGGDSPPWTEWLTLSGPWPNTEDQGTADSVGCYVPGPGGGNCKVGSTHVLCRPAKTCKMKTNNGAFCPVCRDHTIHRIFRHVDLIEDSVFTIAQQSEGVYLLSVGLSETAVHTVWTVNGEPVQDTATFQPLVLDVDSLGSGPHVVTLQVTLHHDWSRVWTDALREEMTVVVDVENIGGTE